MTFAEKLRAALASAKAAAGPAWNAAKWDEVVNATAHAEGVTKLRKPKGAARARNPLFDALALSMGTVNVDQLTRNAAKAVGVALADILAVCPTLTVEEINARAMAYKRRWPDRRNWSASALAKHWAAFGGDPTRTGIAVVAEPKGDWRAAAKLVAERTLDIAVQRSRLEALTEGFRWEQFGPEFRRLIFEEMKANPAAT